MHELALRKLTEVTEVYCWLDFVVGERRGLIAYSRRCNRHIISEYLVYEPRTHIIHNDVRPTFMKQA